MAKRSLQSVIICPANLPLRSIVVLGLLFITFIGPGCEYNAIVETPLAEDPVYIEPPPRFVAIEPTLRSIEDSLFQTTCTTSMCHNSTSRASRLNLSRGTSFTNLVNTPSIQDSTVFRVFPGKPDSSYLVWKLEGHPDMKGRLMPICASEVQCLDSRVINVIREWIANGAPNSQ